MAGLLLLRGLLPRELQGLSTAVFCAVMCDDYSQIPARDLDQLPQYASTGIARSDVFNRVSYYPLRAPESPPPQSLDLHFAKLAVTNSQPGATLGRADRRRALCADRQFLGQVTIAAFNPPNTVTLSGDAGAIVELGVIQKALAKFARILKADTAYHSHHMVPCPAAYI